MHTYRKNDDGKWVVGYYIMAPDPEGRSYAVSVWKLLYVCGGDRPDEDAIVTVNYLNGGNRHQ